MPALLALGREIVGIVQIRRHVMSDALDDADARVLQSGHLRRIVGQQANPIGSKRAEHRGGMRISALVIRKAETAVGSDGVEPAILQGVGADLVGDADPAAFLAKVEKDSTTRSA